MISYEKDPRLCLILTIAENIVKSSSRKLTTRRRLSRLDVGLEAQNNVERFEITARIFRPLMRSLLDGRRYAQVLDTFNEMFNHGILEILDKDESEPIKRIIESNTVVRPGNIKPIIPSRKINELVLKRILGETIQDHEEVEIIQSRHVVMNSEPNNFLITRQYEGCWFNAESSDPCYGTLAELLSELHLICRSAGAMNYD